MAFDEALVGKIREALAGAGAVEEKRMFGGLAFILNGKMCLTAGPDGMMCRVDPARHHDLLRRPGARTVVMRKREMIGWIRVGPEGQRTKKDLEFWFGQALDFNRKARASRK